ncbi:hypothetical protein [Roseomonas sp. BN140053]|uniref:hypothetical protein n=1 Tax=Roseomonas sp. BN140053 TaxID=3391898 RepID=UPI0039EC5E08
MLPLVLLLGLGGCVAEGPLNSIREITGEALQGRAMPPGLSDPSPNLSVVPARPERGEASTREALSTALAASRTQSRQPLDAGAYAGTVSLPVPPATPGAGEVPLAPPAPPRLAAAPPIAASSPTGVLLGGTADPGSTPPAAPPAELIAPAPPPAELTAPPPPDIPAAPRIR